MSLEFLLAPAAWRLVGGNGPCMEQLLIYVSFCSPKMCVVLGRECEAADLRSGMVAWWFMVKPLISKVSFIGCRTKSGVPHSLFLEPSRATKLINSWSLIDIFLIS